MDMLGPAALACGLHMPARPDVCVALGGYYYVLEQRQWQRSDGTCRSDGAGARDGSWAHVRERMRPACGAHVYDARDRSGGMRYASGGSV